MNAVGGLQGDGVVWEMEIGRSQRQVIPRRVGRLMPRDHPPDQGRRQPDSQQGDDELDYAPSIWRASTGRFTIAPLRYARRKASTTCGSNCVPAHPVISSRATSSAIRARYGRSVVIASNASTTDTIRAF